MKMPNDPNILAGLLIAMKAISDDLDPYKDMPKICDRASWLAADLISAHIKMLAEYGHDWEEFVKEFASRLSAILATPTGSNGGKPVALPKPVAVTIAVKEATDDVA